LSSPDNPPVDVHVLSLPPGEKPKPCERAVTLKTYQSSINPESILPHSVARKYARIIVSGAPATHNPVNLCDSQSQAQEIGGLPNGGLLPAGTNIPHYGNSELWIVAVGGLLFPTVTVISEYEK
jgi:hypothetical protein